MSCEPRARRVCTITHPEPPLNLNLDAWRAQVRNELLTAVTGSWKVWPLAHTINFRFVPSSQRVLYINSIQIGYNCFLSIISNRDGEVTTPKKKAVKGKANKKK